MKTFKPYKVVKDLRSSLKSYRVTYGFSGFINPKRYEGLKILGLKV